MGLYLYSVQKPFINFIFFLYSIIILIEISIEFGRKQRLNSEKLETIVKTTFQIAAKIPDKTEPLALVHSVLIRKIHVEWNFSYQCSTKNEQFLKVHLQIYISNIYHT